MRNALLIIGMIVGLAGGAAAAEHNLTLVNVDYEGTKVWVNLPIVANKGDTIKLKLINNVAVGPNQHGFAIPAFGVSSVVTKGEPAEVEFVVDKAGIFPIQCHLHPAHIGGQLVVLE